jgi:hypothetical protein
MSHRTKSASLPGAKLPARRSKPSALAALIVAPARASSGVNLKSAGHVEHEQQRCGRLVPGLQSVDTAMGTFIPKKVNGGIRVSRKVESPGNKTATVPLFARALLLLPKGAPNGPLTKPHTLQPVQLHPDPKVAPRAVSDGVHALSQR